jgi:hypothetical protein
VPFAPEIYSGTLRRMTGRPSSCLLLLSELSLSSLPGIMPAEVQRLFTRTLTPVGILRMCARKLSRRALQNQVG